MNNKGLTLVELLAVIVILALIMILTMPAYNGVAYSIRNQSFQSKQRSINGAMQAYAMKYLLDEIKPAGIINCDGVACCCQYDLNDYIILKGIYLTEQNDMIMNPITNERLTGCVKVRYLFRAPRGVGATTRMVDVNQIESKFVENCAGGAAGTATRCSSSRTCGSW